MTSWGAPEGYFRRRQPWLCWPVVAGSRQHTSTVGIVHIFNWIDLFFGLKTI